MPEIKAPLVVAALAVTVMLSVLVPPVPVRTSPPVNVSVAAPATIPLTVMFEPEIDSGLVVSGLL